MRTTHIEQGQTSVAKIVMDYIVATNEGNFEKAKQYLSHDVIFKDPLGCSSGADAYLKMLLHTQLKLRVKQVFFNGNDVCLLCELAIFGQEISYCGCYQVKQGKITSINAIFDTHPLIELAGKN